MKKTLNVLTIALIAGLSVLVGCGDDGSENPNPGNEVVDDFDRETMLAFWADNIIIPAYTNYSARLTALHAQATSFRLDPNANQLGELHEAWLDAYLAWQQVSMFEIGKAEELTLRSFTNIYPTDTAGIQSNIASGNYNLQLASKYDEQGFPAIEFLLYQDTPEVILSSFQADAAKGQYLTDLTGRLVELTNEVVTGWESGYRDEFVNNSGSSATSAVNKLINDYVFYYEKALRAGKIGIPSGVFSGNPLPHTVEGRFSGVHSKALFMAALDATQNFFLGIATNGTGNGPGMADYLDYLNTIKDGEDLAALINDQFESARLVAQTLNDDFFAQVNADNNAMLATYDELQKNVVFLKVDMMQALNVRVDYVDADGD